MVISKYRFLPSFFIFLFLITLPIAIFALIIDEYYTVGTFSFPFEGILFSLAFVLLACLLQFSFFPNFTTIFDEKGIRRILKCSLGPIPLIRVDNFYSWHSVFEVDYSSWGYFHGFLLGARKNGALHVIQLNFVFTNRVEALDVIFDHVTQYKISKKAHAARKRMLAK